MRTPDQMQALLAQYPAVKATLDDLDREHGQVHASTVEDFPDSQPFERIAERVSGSTIGWFLAVSDAPRIWLISPEGLDTEITDLLPGGRA